EIGLVGLLRDRAEAGEDSIEVSVKRGKILARVNGIWELARNTLPIVVRIPRPPGIICGQWKCINGFVDALVPASGTDALHDGDHRLRDLPLNSQAEHQRPRGFVPVL